MYSITLILDTQSILVLMLMPSLIIPTFKKNVAKGQGQKAVYWKPTITKSRKGLVIHAVVSLF